MKPLITILFLLMSTQVQSGSFPKYPTTSGVICTPKDKDFKEYRYATKMPYCKRNVSTSLRKKVYARYGIKWEDRYHYTIDHLVPLSVSGSNHIDNLWPEHLSIKCKRGRLEFDLYLQVKRGEITPEQAVVRIRRSKLDPNATYVGNYQYLPNTK